MTFVNEAYHLSPCGIRRAPCDQSQPPIILDNAHTHHNENAEIRTLGDGVVLCYFQVWACTMVRSPLLVEQLAWIMVVNATQLVSKGQLHASMARGIKSMMYMQQTIVRTRPCSHFAPAMGEGAVALFGKMKIQTREHDGSDSVIMKYPDHLNFGVGG